MVHGILIHDILVLHVFEKQQNIQAHKKNFSTVTSKHSLVSIMGKAFQCFVKMFNHQTGWNVAQYSKFIWDASFTYLSKCTVL